MNLSISNIAWDASEDEKVYGMMRSLGYTGLEIAPTRIFADNPYGDLKRVRKWKDDIYEKYGFVIPSMQSIWYGRQEKLFGSEEERRILTEYTKKAIDFAEAASCGNLVFGCPKNRAISYETEDYTRKTEDHTKRSEKHTVKTGDNIKKSEDRHRVQYETCEEIALRFFKMLGEYAFQHHTVIAMEANPKIYNTNFVNTTQEAVELVEKVDSKGFLLNLDIGTMLENGETIETLKGKEKLINHIHISEPYLKPIAKRELHRELAAWLKYIDYRGFVSIEAGRQDCGGSDGIRDMMEYVSNVF
ncbi:MAG: sugar phosphate isomerase/epimerase [Lachnospiraceae bacterium]|nr:sugar phosphate isomerase/epimerase [Lachnospiraceae bacterium]